MGSNQTRGFFLTKRTAFAFRGFFGKKIRLSKMTADKNYKKYTVFIQNRNTKLCKIHFATTTLFSIFYAN